ncbi:Threonyl/alanyl tRNA synthetase SAD [Penicillium herquei]|nr:Threonyl/alanyl tRNA synthetase SAD [Penicillium herquei]
MTATKKKKYACDYDGCDKSYGRKDHLKAHIKSNHSGIVYYCKYRDHGCQLEFTSRKDARSHAKVHRGTIFICRHPKCETSFDRKENLDEHVETVHHGAIYFCPYQECDKSYKSQSGYSKHINSKHRGKAYYCEYHDREGCQRTFTNRRNAKNHANVHIGTEFACNYPECEEKFPRKDNLQNHVNFVHLEKNFPCDHTGCTRVFPRFSHLEHHIESVHFGKRFLCAWSECGKEFVNKSGLRMHVDSDHLGKTFDCEEHNCGETFRREDALRRHFRTVHLGQRFPCEYPECGKTYKTKAARDNHFDIVHLGKIMLCEHCGSTFTDSGRLNDHIKSFHTDEIFDCKYREELGCQRQFKTVNQASYHSGTHFPKICQVNRCLVHLQERKMAPGRAQGHYKAHVAAGHYEEGENLPLEVLDKIGSLTDSNAEENGVSTEESAVEDLANVQEIEDLDQEIDILTGQSVIEILTSCFKNQDDQENEKNQELLGEGPGMVTDGLVLGTEVCPNNTIVSSETGLLTRNHGRVHLRIRCAICQARKHFNKVLLKYELKAEPGQKSCEHCLKPLWESTRYCKYHMGLWAPEIPSLSEASMGKLRDLFLKAASKKWSPKTGPMASILKRVNLEEHATSDLLHIDLEFSTRHHNIYQIGISDSKGAKKLNCFPIYSKGMTTNLPSRSPWSQDFQGVVPYRVKSWEKRWRRDKALQ